MKISSGLHCSALVKEKVEENAKTVSLVLDISLGAQPGQFAMIWLPGLDEKPFSISGDDPLMFTITRVGPFSDALHSLGPGDRLWVRGPFGNGFGSSSGRLLLVGGGYGAAPLYFLAQRLLRAASSMEPSYLSVALGARVSSELLFAGRFDALGVDLRIATEDGSAGVKGMVSDVIRPLMEPGGVDRLYSCGPKGMLEAMAALCRKTGIRGELSHEAYMRCGIGLCGSCERGGRLACLDGPVFMV